MAEEGILGPRESYIPYLNVIALLRARKDYTDPPMSFDEFKAHSASNLYIRVVCPGGYVAIFVHSSKATVHISKLISDTKKLIQKLAGSAGCLFVAPFDMEGAMISKVSKLEKDIGNGTKIRPYWQFLFNLLENVACSEHRVLSRDETATLVKESYISTDAIARMSEGDPMVLWIGAEVGDIVEIKRPSPVSLIGYEYRRVIPMSREG